MPWASTSRSLAFCLSVRPLRSSEHAGVVVARPCQLGPVTGAPTKRQRVFEVGGGTVDEASRRVREARGPCRSPRNGRNMTSPRGCRCLSAATHSLALRSWRASSARPIVGERFDIRDPERPREDCAHRPETPGVGRDSAPRVPPGTSPRRQKRQPTDRALHAGPRRRASSSSRHPHRHSPSRTPASFVREEASGDPATERDLARCGHGPRTSPQPAGQVRPAPTGRPRDGRGP